MKRWFTRSICVLGVIAVWSAVAVYDSRAEPRSVHDAVASLNGGAVAQQHVQEDEAAKNALSLMAGALTSVAVVVFGLSFYPDRYRIRLPRSAVKQSMAVLALGGVMVFSQAGCWKAYDTPEYSDVDTAETAFVVPLEGDSNDQSKFQSETFLENHKVATKRVQIIHRWNQTGRMPGEGAWIAAVRLIKVNRSPITREWTADATNGTTAKDQAIWVESGDSVGFSIGFTATAHITEENASKFLYWYPAGSLADVMDHEVRGRIQQVAAEVSAKFPLDTLRGRKQDIVDAVRKDLTTFFAERGITVTTVGMFGGMTYENPKIQQAIDEVFIAQQLKDVALAKFDAQSKQNEQVNLEAEGIAKKTQTQAMAEAQAKVTAAEADAKVKIAAAEAEAKAIQATNQALQNAGPQLLAIRQLEMERARIEKWNGAYPTYFMGTGANAPNLMMQMPTPPENTAK